MFPAEKYEVKSQRHVYKNKEGRSYISFTVCGPGRAEGLSFL